MCIRLQRKRGIMNKCLHYMVNVILSFSLQILHHIYLAGRMQQPSFKLTSFHSVFHTLISEVLCRLLGVATVMTTGALISLEFWVDWIHKYLSAWKKDRFHHVKNKVLIFWIFKTKLCVRPQGKLHCRPYTIWKTSEKTRCILKMIF